MVRFTKKTVGCIAMLLLGNGVLSAQSFIQKQRSESLTQKEIKAFSDPEIRTIPVEGRSIYKDTREGKKQKTDNFAKVYPMSSNPKLAAAIKKQNGGAKAEGDGGPASVKELNLGWGLVSTIEDGKQYIFTQEMEKSVPSGVYGTYYRSATYKIYNDDFEEIKSFKISSSDTTMYFNLAQTISSKVFNSDNKWEFLIQIHGFAGQASGPESCRDTIVIIDENSQILNRFAWSSGVVLDKKTDEYGFSSYNLGIYEAEHADANDEQVVRYYSPRSIGTELDVLPEPVFEKRIPQNLLSYTHGLFFNQIDIEGEKFYVSSFYEKPFIANDDIYDPEVEKNNKFIIQLYDMSFNLVKEMKLPLIGLDQHEISMSSIGTFGEYMITKHVFNSDDKYEIVYGMSRYYSETDSEMMDYYLVNEDGEILKEMFTNTADIMNLQKIPGQSDEYAVLLSGNGGVSGIMMYKMPEMKEVFTFPATHNGDYLSLNFGRVPVGNSYEYVFGLGRGENADNTVYGGIVHYDVNGKRTKKVRIDLGPTAALFTPLLDAGTMNPYTFVPDDKSEYVFFAKKYTDDYESIYSVFGIANDEKTIYSWADNDDYSLSGGGILANSEQTYQKNMYLTYVSKSDMSESKTVFFDLPLQAVALEGDGTEASPYLISNPSELDMMRNHQDAYFELTCDIDMAAYTGVNNNGFVPIPSFTGNFNGNNHVIKNLAVNSNGMYAGLFAEVMDGGEVKNLRLENVKWSNLASSSWGTVTGNLSGATIENCHVTNNVYEAGATMPSNMDFGGIAGQISFNAVIANSSFEGEVVLPGAGIVGGIVGRQTGSKISNCYVKGKLAGNDCVGGISGYSANGAVISNNYSSADISGVTQIGGIAGAAHGCVIEKNYASGSVCGDMREGEQYVMDAGGVVGILGLNMMSENSVAHNVALNEKVVMPSNLARVAYTETEGSLSDNYALASMLIGPDSDNLATVNESDATTVGADKVHGKSVAKEELDQKFYETMGWSFGKGSESPWVMTDGYPRFWYEFIVRGVKLDVDKLTMDKGAKYTLKPEIVPADATNQNVRYASSDLKVASVSATGEITARGVGSADITVTTEEGLYKAVCHVTVVIPVEKVVISKENVRIGVGERAQLSATVLPEDATNKNIVWKSENNDVAYMLENNVVGVAPGTTSVIAMTEDGKVSDTCVVTVTAPVEDLYLEETMITLDSKTPSHQLVAHLVPETAGAVLIWETEDASIADVDKNGLVTGHKKGEVIVTVSTEDRKFSADCLVEVAEDIDPSLGIDEIEGTRVFVNGDAIVVVSEGAVSKVGVFDATGQQRYAGSAANNSRMEISVAGWTSGVYVVKVTFVNGESRIYKVML